MLLRSCTALVITFITSLKFLGLIRDHLSTLHSLLHNCDIRERRSARCLREQRDTKITRVFQDFPMSGGPEGGPMGPMGPNTMGPVLNGDGLDGMKNSPANGGPGTPREDSGSGMGDYNLSGFGAPGENVSMLRLFDNFS